MIQIKEKDADFILSILRDEVNCCKDAYNKAVAMINEQVKEEREKGIFSEEMLKELEKKCFEYNEDKFHSAVSGYQKAIEILTLGSEEE